MNTSRVLGLKSGLLMWSLCVAAVVAPAKAEDRIATVRVKSYHPVVHAEFEEGARVNSNRNYTYKQTPAALHGLQYILHPHDSPTKLEVEVIEGGMLYVATFDGKGGDHKTPGQLGLDGDWEQVGSAVTSPSDRDYTALFYRTQVTEGQAMTLPSTTKWGTIVMAGKIVGAGSSTDVPAEVAAALEREFGRAPEVQAVRRKSYSDSYDRGSIGVKLSADQWRESQAWQALAGYNMAKHARHHDIDSLVWCTLRGGGNSVSYMKPLIDFHDHAKLAFYTYRSAIEDYFAASEGVDVAYGPEDTITPVVIGLGDARAVNVTLACIDQAGRVAATRTYRNVELPEGRPIVKLDPYKPDVNGEGYYGVAYTIDDGDQTLGRSFELKFITPREEANGQTDFIGGGTFFDDAQRIEYLSHYARQACRFFDDPDLNKKVVTDEQVAEVMANIKPQPLPEVRRRMRLNDGWRYVARREGETQQDQQRLATWAGEGLAIRDGRLVITADGVRAERDIPAQDWRFFVAWDVQPVAGKTAGFVLAGERGELLEVAIDGRGEVSAAGQRAGRIAPGTTGTVQVEVDLQYGQFTVSIDGEPTLYGADLPNPAVREVTRVSIRGDAGVGVDNIRGTGYDPRDDIRNGIYKIDTFIDEDFAVAPEIDGWQGATYSDARWAEAGELPLIVGSERHRGRDIFMRRTVRVPAFERAYLNLDALDPSGEVFINGESVAKLDRQPTRLDVSRFLKPGENQLAVRVDHVSNRLYGGDGHTSTDTLYGWFAGRMSLDLTGAVNVEDLFVYTEDLGEPATMRFEAIVTNHGRAPFEGKAILRMFRWFPTESAEASGERAVDLSLKPGETKSIEQAVRVGEPKLWHYDRPNLYKATVTLVDGGGEAADDYAVTTGIRTISEEGGTFRLNGKPEIMNGATWMQFPAPLTESTTWHRCCPESWIVKGMLMTRAMGANTLRKHEPSCSYSDPRFGEIGDQMGVMNIWVSTGWMRKNWTNANKHPDGSKKSVDESIAEYVNCMKQVRNHPSIVMWEIYNEGVRNAKPLINAFHPQMYDADPSRFIMPVKGYWRDDPMMCKGGQIDTLGYGKKWAEMREGPLDHLDRFKNSDQYGMYAVEFAEVVGQANWDLYKCKPWYRLHSYEWGPDLYEIRCTVDGKEHRLKVTETGRVID